jgi:hypothetical protein
MWYHFHRRLCDTTSTVDLYVNTTSTGDTANVTSTVDYVIPLPQETMWYHFHSGLMWTPLPQWTMLMSLWITYHFHRRLCLHKGLCECHFYRALCEVPMLFRQSSTMHRYIFPTITDQHTHTTVLSGIVWALFLRWPHDKPQHSFSTLNYTQSLLKCKRVDRERYRISQKGNTTSILRKMSGIQTQASAPKQVLRL